MLQEKYQIVSKEQSNSKAILRNQIIMHVLKCSVSLLAVQFKLKNYGSNQIIKKMKKEVQEIKQNPQAEFCLQIWNQISYFLWFLSTSQKIFIQMICNQQIYAIQSQTVHLNHFKVKFYHKVKNQTIKCCKYARQFTEMCEQSIYLLMEQILRQFSQFFYNCQQIVQEQIQWATQQTKNSKFMNFYILFKILLDTSLTCYKKIQTNSENQILTHIDGKSIQMISQYYIKKFQSLKFQYGQTTQNQSKERMFQRLKKQNFVFFNAFSEKNQNAIFIQFQKNQLQLNKQQLKISEKQQHSNAHTYFLLVCQENQLLIKNCCSLYYNWRAQHQQLSKQKIAHFLQNQEKLKQFILSIKSKKNIQKCKTIPSQSMIGQCLADIKNYQSLSNFMLDLSKNMAFQTPVNIMVMMTAIPILGYLFTTGGYTYSFYTIFNNKFATFDKKMQQIGVATLNTVSSLSTGIIGGFLGQAFIPVPIVGAFVGGLIGGLIGAVGAHFASNLIQKKRFKQLIFRLKTLYNQEGYWKVNKQILQILGIDFQHFDETIPENITSLQNKEQLWLTLLCFTLYSLHQAKQRQIFMEISMKKIQKMQKQNKQIMTPTQYKQNFDYQPSIDMVKIIKYLSHNDLKYLELINEVEQFVQKMYSRIV